MEFPSDALCLAARKVFDLPGQKVFWEGFNLVPGTNEITARTDGLQSGVYIYRLHARGEARVGRVTVLMLVKKSISKDPAFMGVPPFGLIGDVGKAWSNVSWL